MISLIPAVLALGWEIYSCLKEQPRTWRDPDDTPEARPPPTAPRSAPQPTPTAPPASQDGAIPMATAEVVGDGDAYACATAPVEPMAAPATDKN